MHAAFHAGEPARKLVTELMDLLHDDDDRPPTHPGQSAMILSQADYEQWLKENAS